MADTSPYLLKQPKGLAPFELENGYYGMAQSVYSCSSDKIRTATSLKASFWPPFFGVRRDPLLSRSSVSLLFRSVSEISAHRSHLREMAAVLVYVSVINGGNQGVFCASLGTRSTILSQPPPSGILKINTDVATFGDD
ncbi:unnamed protein product [Dovyalis caffra]|uniref:Uncharacterized protein n=1 Tax=Dovyalis caffra TaxID=77055 RepID=A0AAV1RTL9_9ROSI|nr:unnamed protein product [Dovyalis caffra]